MDISHLQFVDGRGDGQSTACLLSARSLLDGRPFGDDHPSAVLRRVGIWLNDGQWWRSDTERTATLLPVALDGRLCASRCDASPAAEARRAGLCADWASSFVAPLARDCGAAVVVADDVAADAVAAASRYAAAAVRYAAEGAAPVINTAVCLSAVLAAHHAVDAALIAADEVGRATAEKIKIRDSLIALFGRLLDVRAEVQS